MSKKKMKPQEEVKGDVNMSPMIDCCFLLLIFFVVNATALTVSKDPSVNMPNAVSCSDLKDANGCIVVNIFADPDKMSDKAREQYNKHYSPGTVFGVSDGTKDTGYSIDQVQLLTDFITQQKEVMKNRNLEEKAIRIYLRGDQDTPWERTATAIRCAAAAGVTNMVFGTLPAKM